MKIVITYKYIIMRKIYLALMLLPLIGFFACEGKIAPVILLDGGDEIDHVLNRAFVEPGYSAFDDADGDITTSVTVSVLDVNIAGDQDLVYTVEDSDGNITEVIRTVNIFNEMNVLSGNWSGEYVYPYPSIDKQQYLDSLVVSSTTNMYVTFKHFGGYINSNIEGRVVLSGIPNAPAILFEGQTVGALAFTAERASITDDFTRITFEYTIGDQDGVLVLAKQ